MTERETEPGDGARDSLDAASTVSDAIDDELDARNADAFVHVGPACDPEIRYLPRAVDRPEEPSRARTPRTGRPGTERAERSGTPRAEPAIHAVARDGSTWYHRSAEPGESSPAAVLATDLVDGGLDGVVLTPATVPHDAALYLEEAGLSLASSDVLARSRTEKSPAERERIERAGTAASAGLEAAAAVLDGGGLATGGDPVTAERLRIAADRAIVDAGAFPAGNTRVSGPGGTLAAGEPIVVALAPRGPEGYHAVLVRTLVVAGEGGDERRAHVALTRAFRSTRALLSGDRSASVADVERDLEAEIRAFGFEEGIETDVAGVGLEPRERPLRGDEPIPSDAMLRVGCGVETDRGAVRLAETLAPGDGWLAAPSRSLDPAAVLDRN